MSESKHHKDVGPEAPATDESGQGLAEYALILVFIALVCVAALGLLGQAIAGSSAWTIP
jgi:Flp pilus assembly pilin Flp